MKYRTKIIISVLGLLVISIAVYRCCKPHGSKLLLVPLPSDNNQHTAAFPLSHAIAREADPMTAFLKAFDSPITLYGKVVDQHGDPIPAGIVTLQPVDKPFGDQSNSKTTLVSDANGKFSISGLHGYSMGVSVRKEGYLYLSPLGGPATSVMLNYGPGSEQGKRHSRAENPVVLTLHKIGLVEPMVFVKDQRCSLPVDGTPRAIALDSQKGNGPHQVEFRFTSNWNQLPNVNESNFKRFDWKLEAKIPGGGFIWSGNDYNFEAPVTGYQETIRVEYQANMPIDQWKKLAYGSFFVKFADGCYGRIRFNIEGFSDNSPLTLESWLNLKPGSHNLATQNMTPSSACEERYKKEWK